MVLKKLSQSTTLNSWVTYLFKALSLFIVIPLLLSSFSAELISLWYLFSSVSALISIVDFGFKSTFVRFIAFTLSGKEWRQYSIPKDLTIEELITYLKFFYQMLAIVSLIGAFTLGSLLIYKPIELSGGSNIYWIAWVVLIIASSFRLYGNMYLAYLEGYNRIVRARRNETYGYIGAIGTSLLILFFIPDFIALVISNQLWLVVIVALHYFNIPKDHRKLFRRSASRRIKKERIVELWRPAWRSGLSGFMSNGLTQITSLLFAQITNVNVMASYLLALKLISQVKEISMAPFYSKIPLLASLRASEEINKIKSISQRGMLLSYTVFVTGFIGIDLFSNEILDFIDSNVAWVDRRLWIMLGSAFLIHRFGAMHIQLYSTTNNIISHIADGVSGIIYLLVSFSLINVWGIYSIPAGMIAGYLGFYAFYASKHSYLSVESNFLNFEKKAIIIPLSIYIIYNLIFYVR